VLLPGRLSNPAQRDSRLPTRMGGRRRSDGIGRRGRARVNLFWRAARRGLRHASIARRRPGRRRLPAFAEAARAVPRGAAAAEGPHPVAVASARGGVRGRSDASPLLSRLRDTVGSPALVIRMPWRDGVLVRDSGAATPGHRDAVDNLPTIGRGWPVPSSTPSVPSRSLRPGPPRWRGAGAGSVPSVRLQGRDRRRDTGLVMDENTNRISPRGFRQKAWGVQPEGRAGPAARAGGHLTGPPARRQARSRKDGEDRNAGRQQLGFF